MLSLLNFLVQSLVFSQLLSRIASGYMKGRDWLMLCDLVTKGSSLKVLGFSWYVLAPLIPKVLSLVCLIGKLVFIKDQVVNILGIVNPTISVAITQL